MENVLAVILIFGGGATVAFAFSPIGRAIAERVRGPAAQLPLGATDPAILEELDRLRIEMGEVQERLDFAERMLASRSEHDALKRPAP